MTLDALAKHHGTDKSTLQHGYTRVYEHLLWPVQREDITLLELGYGGHTNPDKGGESARMWRDWMPNARIVVVDYYPKNNIPEGVNFHQGDQADPVFIKTLADRYAPFWAVIDDASHLSSKSIASFKLLYPHVSPGGLYVVEDSHQAYHDWFYGKAEANCDPDKPTAYGEPTVMQFFKRLADETNYHNDGHLFPAAYHLGYDLAWVAFTYNLILVRKRGNDWGSSLW